jgi:hypothetical protein
VPTKPFRSSARRTNHSYECGRKRPQQIARVRPGAEPARAARHCHDQPQHATRMLTVGDPTRVNAGFDFSAAASSASSAMS